MKKIEQIVNGEYDSHLMPFLWMHGEEQSVIKEYLEKIYESGMKSVCLESRPYENFLQEAWWKDLDFIMRECRRLGMKVWILDDKHFPTGYAAGAVQNKYPHLRKMFLEVRSLDFVGPRKNAAILLKWLKSGRQNVMNVGTDGTELKNGDAEDETELLCVLAAKKTGYKKIDETTIRVLPYKEKEQILRWDMPEGEWSIFAIFTTYEGGENATEGYLNPLMKEAVQILLNTVYEPHYVHLKEWFGTVIQGFFSDEPRFGNRKGADASIGRVEMPLPWRPGLEWELMEQAGISGKEMYQNLLLLFVGESEKAHEMRYQYMEMVSRLYSQNFSDTIGNWCRDHHVNYIGHVLEDNNAHARLGYGAGHFFRAISGQDMAGIDVVLHQLMPRQNRNIFRSYTSAGWDGEFFTYGLAKLGASSGHLDPLKKGKTMCEVFGAYGWSEGLKFMKWIADHMLSRGINYFVPHAFDMKGFPDPDCPPHFYAHGNNFEFDSMKVLNQYIDRTASLLTGGTHGGNTGILYHAESEWAGDYMLFQKPARVLTEHQVEFDIVSADMLFDEDVKNIGYYTINNKKFYTLIIPYAQRISSSLAKKILELAERQVQIIILEKIPSGLCGKNASAEIMRRLKEEHERGKIQCIELDNLPLLFTEKTDRLILDSRSPYLRYYHYHREDGEVFVLFNEDMYEDLEVRAIFPGVQHLQGYDPMENKKRKIIKDDGRYLIRLAKGELLVLYTEENAEESKKIVDDQQQCNEDELQYYDLKTLPWTVEIAKGFGQPQKKYWEFACLPELNDMKEWQDFSGELVFRTDFVSKKENTILNIEEAYEIVNVKVNDVNVGTRISYPYRFDLSQYLKEGNNRLEIHITNSLGRYMKDYLSQFMFIDPLGMEGKVGLEVVKEDNLRKKRR